MDREKLDFINSVRNHWFLRNVVFSSDVLTFIAAQFALESNYGTSSLALTRNNYCGMKIPHRRVSYRIFSIRTVDSFDAFASFATFDDCIFDYVSWLFYQRPYQNVLQDVSAFKIFLRNSGYCPERDYIERIELIYNLISN